METKEIVVTDETLQGDVQGTGSAHVESELSALGNALQAVSDAATGDDTVLRILSWADGIASGMAVESAHAVELGMLMVTLKNNPIALGSFIEKAAHIQGVVDLTGVKGFNNVISYVLWNPAVSDKNKLMQLPGSPKAKQSVGAKRVSNWIKAFENDANDEKVKTTTVTDVLAALLYKEECIAYVEPQSVLRALGTVYDADRVQKWAEKAHDKAIKAGYIPATVEPESK